eukprot:765104-Hanusia_phi.AAC.18
MAEGRRRLFDGLMVLLLLRTTGHNYNRKGWKLSHGWVPWITGARVGAKGDRVDLHGPQGWALVQSDCLRVGGVTDGVVEDLYP